MSDSDKSKFLSLSANLGAFVSLFREVIIGCGTVLLLSALLWLGC